MKTTTFKSMIAVLLALFSLNANAYDVVIDGIYYNLIEKIHTAEVTRGNQEYTSYSGDIIIPHSIEYNGVTYSVTTIDQYAFWQCYYLSSLFIPSSITSISPSSFYDNRNLNSVTIEITNLADWCTNPLNNIGGDTHYLSLNGEIIQDLVIPNGVTTIGESAFSCCRGLTSVNIPNSVTSIGKYAFKGCSGLASVIIPNNVTEIGLGAFCECTGLTTINVPNSVTQIEENAFNGCSGLTSVIIGNCVTTIGSHAFANCSDLKSVTISNSVEFIDKWAFSGCI